MRAARAARNPCGVNHPRNTLAGVGCLATNGAHRASGGTLTVTRAGVPVAELPPRPCGSLGAVTLLNRWQRLPYVDAERLRRDLDEALDSAL